MGYKVTVYEALHVAGGVLMYGIPEFRLPKAIVAEGSGRTEGLGVTIETPWSSARHLSIDELMDEYGFEAVFIGSGAGLPMFMDIPGENYKGVYVRQRVPDPHQPDEGLPPDSETPIIRPKKVAVVGGGNVAMDAARCAKRLGAEKVYIVYRRGMAELPARREEVEHAEEEGILFKTLLTNPTAILADENDDVRGHPLHQDGAGRAGCLRPPPPRAEWPGSEFELDVGLRHHGLGTRPNPLLTRSTPGLAVNDHGGLIVTDAEETSLKNVYAGGDAVTGSATVIKAMGAGKHAAAEIDRRLNAKQ
jgi:glutamate synthase (NADPH/NADH) small chain